ncbi:hypothetical protein D1BOALGB6SA_604 [Olavius sp. associated proteobacterium Delta 1]|nr:hypothetical protein D1BOALGB6SA_604 [Olavius sp. associated proteobacterium Delta 1]
MEWWNIDLFARMLSNFDNVLFAHYPRTHFSIVPTFQLSNKNKED